MWYWGICVYYQTNYKSKIDERKKILEALIFASDAPMNENQICAVIYDIDEKSVLGKAEIILQLSNNQVTIYVEGNADEIIKAILDSPVTIQVTHAIPVEIKKTAILSTT